MANSQSTTSYALPFELIQEICELSASAFPSSIPRLSLVAHQFRHWVEPELYRILRIDEGVVKPPIFFGSIRRQTSLRNVWGSRPINIPYLQKFGHHVRHALLHDCHTKEITQILRHIPSVQNLAIWAIGSRNPEPASLAPCLESMHEASSLSLKNFSCHLLEIYQCFRIIPFHKSYFRELTHLEVEVGDDHRWFRWKEIRHLDKLTHLCVCGTAMAVGFAAYLLRNCTKLEVLIFHCLDDDLIEVSESDQDEDDYSVSLAVESTIPVRGDPRVVRMRDGEDTDNLNNWEVGARGGTSFWDAASWVVQERKDSGWSGDNSLEIIDFGGAQQSE